MINRASRVAIGLVLAAQWGCVSGVMDPAPLAIGNAVPVAALQPADADTTLTVMTVNLAHGRATGFHQVLQSAATARENLDALAAVLVREAPHIVAMQEADGPSIWSGGFCHPCYVAGQAGYAYGWLGLHARGAGLEYGTAIIGRSPLTAASKATFSGAWFTTPKGFTAAAIRWPGTVTEVDVVSVHLDALRPAVRRSQMARLASAYADRRRPLILMGDLNTPWSDELAGLADALGLTAWQPHSDSLDTFRRLGGRRLDWILVSEDIRFLEHRVLDDPVSDHRPVVATLVLIPSEPGAGGAAVAAAAP